MDKNTYHDGYKCCDYSMQPDLESTYDPTDMDFNVNDDPDFVLENSDNVSTEYHENKDSNGDYISNNSLSYEDTDSDYDNDVIEIDDIPQDGYPIQNNTNTQNTSTQNTDTQDTEIQDSHLIHESYDSSFVEKDNNDYFDENSFNPDYGDGSGSLVNNSALQESNSVFFDQSDNNASFDSCGNLIQESYDSSFVEKDDNPFLSTDATYVPDSIDQYGTVFSCETETETETETNTMDSKDNNKHTYNISKGIKKMKIEDIIDIEK